jgi:hypothetical protein
VRSRSHLVLLSDKIQEMGWKSEPRGGERFCGEIDRKV